MQLLIEPESSNIAPKAGFFQIEGITQLIEPVRKRAMLLLSIAEFIPAVKNIPNLRTCAQLAGKQGGEIGLQGLK